MKINKLINEEINKYVNNIITESQESSSQKKAKKLAMQHSMSKQEADDFVRVGLRNDITSLRDRNTAKFTLGCARLFFERQLTDAKSINLLNNVIALIAKKYIDKFDQNLNGLSLNELSNQFSSELEEIEQQNKNDVNSKAYENNGYQIVPINSFEEAEEYSDYTNIGEDYHWCITYRKDMWNRYTQNGINQVYFCLKNGFENIEPHPNGNPKDDYGLSMISVIVDDNGRLAYCTLRWNHGNNASGDNALTVQELSEIVGVNFYETFKPNNRWEELLSQVKQRLASGEDPYDIFDDCREFKNDFTVVELSGKFNYIDRNNKLLSEQWFDVCYDFENSFAPVFLNDKGWNYIDTNGKILSNQWFDECYSFNINGLALVRLNNKKNFIDTNGNYLSSQWFDECDEFENGFAVIKLNDKGYNYIDTNVKLLSPNQWFDDCWNFSKNGFAKIRLNDKLNFIDTNGNYLSSQWFDECRKFKNGFAQVYLKDKGWNYIDTNYNYLSSQWFDECYEFENGFAEVRLNNKLNFIDTNGKILSNQWFDECYEFENGFVVVQINNKYNYLDTNGKILSPNQWFDNCCNFHYDCRCAEVTLGNKICYIDKNGKLYDDFKQ